MKYMNVILAVLLLAASVFGYSQWELSRIHKNNFDSLAAQYQTYDQKLGRAELEVGNAKQKVSQLEKDVQAEIERYNGQVTAYGKLSAKYTALVKSKPTEVEVTSTVEVPVKEPVTPFRLFWSKSEYDLVQLPPDLKLTFKDERQDLVFFLLSRDGKLVQAVEYNLHLRFTGQLAEVTLPNGKTAYYADLWEINSKGEKVTQLQFEDFSVIKQDRREQKIRLAPHLDIGGIAGAGLKQGNLVSGLSLGVSAWGYGKTENDLTWRFPRVGLAVSSDFVAVEFDPVMYNLGSPLPVVSNIWIGPGVIWNPSGFGLVLSLNAVL